VRFDVAMPGAIPHGDGAFDHVLAFNLFHLVENRAAMFAEILRVLKPGGLMISKTPCLSEMNPLFRVAVPLAQLLRKAPFVDFFAATGLEAEIVAAGFPVIERARHGTTKKDARIFLVARKPA
jgi:SAM-dependent methyltransferase